MTEKHGYIGGLILGIIIYSFSNSSILGGYLTYQAQVLMEYFPPFLTIIAAVMGAALIFKKIHVKTTERGLILGASGTVAILWILGNYVPS